MTSQIEELEEKFVRMTLLVGVILGRLGCLVSSKYVSGESKEHISALINYITPKVQEIYYPEIEQEVPVICPFCNQVHQGTVNCKRRIFIDDPKVPRPEQVSQPYKTEWQPVCPQCEKYHGDRIDCWPPNCS